MTKAAYSYTMSVLFIMLGCVMTIGHNIFVASVFFLTAAIWFGNYLRSGK